MFKTIVNRLLSCNEYNKANAEQDAWHLLQKLTGKTKVKLITKETIELSPQQKRILSRWLNLIAKNSKPIQYIIGWVPFCDTKILVKPPILIPRPETEYMCNSIIKKLKKTSKQMLKILDLCSGSGCIGLSIAHEFKNFDITCTDINPKAISLIKKNIKYNNIKNVNVIKSNLFEKILNKTFDLIISNPPYITAKEWQNLDKNITLWEDRSALVADKDGLEIIKKIIKKTSKYLIKNSFLSKNKIPQLILEIGEEQGSKTLKIIQSVNIFNAKKVKDLQQKDRWIEASYK